MAKLPLPAAVAARIDALARKDLANLAVLLFLSSQIGAFVFLGPFVFNWREPLSTVNIIGTVIFLLLSHTMAVSQQRISERFMNTEERLAYYRSRAQRGLLPDPVNHARAWGGLYLVALLAFGLTLQGIWDQPYDLATLGVLLVLNWGACKTRLLASLEQHIG
ncbi:MAG: hypothetical protein G01um101431_738 [Parcubacteria group bacterium Gr01-1014_31]|nr:MAG: hypothetical protein G01um101431_738 [Parcubacteria group bacterium Gr01-1014_31]